MSYMKKALVMIINLLDSISNAKNVLLLLK